MHSVGMRINKKLLATIAVPVLLGGWALFRPELIFVNKTVDEKLPVSAASTQTLSQLAVGSFTSQAHETKGTAEIVRIGDKTYLQLKNFSTSNGPDVRVYLTSGGNPGKESLSLGSLKGNIGTQNYELPKTYDPTTHQAVSIWCERFAVGFGLAALKQSDQTQSMASPSVQSVSYSASLVSKTEVTFGKTAGDSRFKGSAALLEENGKRWAEVRFDKFAAGHELRLVKKETLAAGEFPKAEFVPLTAPKKDGSRQISRTPLDKKIDLWLYRSIGILDSKTKKVVGWIHLRSEQENKKSSSILTLV